MRKTLPFLAIAVLGAVFGSGCANVEKKFSRGLSNTLEPVRLGEMRRSIEQAGVFDGYEAAASIGFISGLNRTLARTGLGVYEMITAPFPSYDPIWTNYLEPRPVYPDSYTPRLPNGSTFATDTSLGFGGGDALPLAPGSRFHVFDGL